MKFRNRTSAILALSLGVFVPSLPSQTTSALNPEQQTLSKVWVSDKGDGTYRNPILYADYSDPDAIRVGDDYYLVASSFDAVPGLPILHSKDLVNWTILSHALRRQPPYDVYSKTQHGNGVWAPAIRYHEGEYYIYYPDPEYGIYLTKAKTPEGPWSEPILIKEAKGWIDPCPFWDDDGNAYLVNALAGILLHIRPRRRSAYRMAASTSLQKHLRALRRKDRHGPRQVAYQRAASRSLG